MRSRVTAIFSPLVSRSAGNVENLSSRRPCRSANLIILAPVPKQLCPYDSFAAHALSCSIFFVSFLQVTKIAPRTNDSQYLYTDDILRPVRTQRAGSFQHGTRLADEVYVALIVDPRTVGESTGQTRRLENLKIKNEDAQAGLDYLVQWGDVVASHFFLVAFCQGGPESLDIASYDDRVCRVASVSGYFRDYESDIYMICAECVAWKPGEGISSMEMPTAAQGEALTGEVICQPPVDPKAGDPDAGSLAGLPGPIVWSRYGAWTLEGFENRYAVMSDLGHFSYTTVPGVAKLQKLVLIVRGDNCMNSAAARRHYDSIPTSKKKLIWDNETSHFQHHDQPDCVDRIFGEIVTFQSVSSQRDYRLPRADWSAPNALPPAQLGMDSLESPMATQPWALDRDISRHM